VTLLEQIVSEQLAPGTRLRQEALAERLGVSRTPLREALMRLASEGLVEFEPNRGATVARREFGGMEQAWRARLAVEPGAARLAAELRDPEAIAAMRSAVEAQRRAFGDIPGSHRVNREFHLALVAGAGNGYLSQFAEMLWMAKLSMPIFASQAMLAREPEQILAWADEHEAIADAVAAGDPERAQRLTRDHIAAYPPPSEESR
jgi:DNA-binding GntR family transcriptional regulator